MSPGSYFDPIHDRQQAEKLREKERHRKRLDAYKAQFNAKQAMKAEVDALKAKRDKKAAVAKMPAPSPSAAEKRKRDVEQESEEQDTNSSSSKKIKTDSIHMSSFASLISESASEELKMQEGKKSPFADFAPSKQTETTTATPSIKSFSTSFANSPFALSTKQMETATATPSSKDGSPSTAVTSPEPEELKVKTEKTSPSIEDTKQMEITTSTPTSEEISTPTSSGSEKPKKEEEAESPFVNTMEPAMPTPTTQELSPSTSSRTAEGKKQEEEGSLETNKDSAADDDDDDLDEIDKMLIGDKPIPEDGDWDKNGIWKPKPSQEKSQPKAAKNVAQVPKSPQEVFKSKSIKETPQSPKQKRKRGEEEDTADRNQDHEARELSANKRRKIDPAPTIQAQPPATQTSREAPPPRETGFDIYERYSKLARKTAAGKAKPPTTQTPRADSPPGKRKLVRKSDLPNLSQARETEFAISDEHKTDEQVEAGSSEGAPSPTLPRAPKKPSVAPDAKEAQVGKKSANPPVYYFKEDNGNGESVFGTKTGQVLKDKRTNPQATDHEKTPKAAGQNIIGGKASSRNHVSGSVRASDTGKNVSNGQREDKVSASLIKKILPRPGLPLKGSSIYTPTSSDRSTPAVQNSRRSATSVPSSAVSRKRKAESEADNPAKRVRPSPPTGLYNFNKAGWFNSVLQCLHATPAFREYYKGHKASHDQNSLDYIIDYERLEKVGKGAKKGVVRAKDSFRKWLADSSRVWSFQQELGLLFGKMSQENDEALMSFMLNQLFALKVKDGMNGEAQRDAADMIRPLLEAVTKAETVANGSFRGGINPFEFTPGRKLQCECGSVEFESSGSQMRESILYGFNHPWPTTIEECIKRGHPDIDVTGQTCSKCGSDEITKSRIFEGNAPESLIVRFNRFSPTGKKLGNKVKFSVDLDLSRFCKQETKYELNAICLHEGDTVDSGEYRALVHGEDGDWYIVENEIVDKVENVKRGIRELSREGYMFFYTKTKG